MGQRSRALKPAPVKRRYTCDRRSRPIPPDPKAWLHFVCERCSFPFRIQGISRHCQPCRDRYEVHGIYHGGEMSGS